MWSIFLLCDGPSSHISGLLSSHTLSHTSHLNQEQSENWSLAENKHVVHQAHHPLLPFLRPKSVQTLPIHHVCANPSTLDAWKVAIVLSELDLPYNTVMVDMADMKKEPFTKINPNGRVPAIEDPNTGVTLWESGAINSYLVETYDKEHKLTYTTVPEKFQVQQWLHFQMSGQGPYYGQAAWFTFFHHEKLPSARERYVKEMERVMGVLDGWLAERKYLVGDKATFADLAFITWHNMVGWICAEDPIDVKGKYPNYSRWMESLLERPAVKKVIAEKAEAAKAAH